LVGKCEGIDIRKFKYKHPNFYFIQVDARKTRFPSNFFDYAYAVSSIEHIGLSGRYRVVEDDPIGDIKAVKEIERVLKPSETLLVTLPYGRRAIIKPSHARDALLR
jgi:SAM-dependent methyltransferase